MKRVCGRVASLVGLWVATGCAGQAVDLGPGDTTEPSLAGTYTATLSSGAFVASPVPLRLTLDAEGQGTLLVGESALPPPTDPTLGYPPEAEADAGQASGLLLHLYSGIEYSLGAVTVASRRLHFEVDALDAFRPLCALQVPMQTSLGYGCLPNWGGGVDRTGGAKTCYQNDPSGARVQVDCVVLDLCALDLVEARCACAQSSCEVSDGGSPVQASFELTLADDGATLAGTHAFGAVAVPAGSAQAAVTFTRETD